MDGLTQRRQCPIASTSFSRPRSLSARATPGLIPHYNWIPEEVAFLPPTMSFSAIATHWVPPVVNIKELHNLVSAVENSLNFHFGQVVTQFLQQYFLVQFSARSKFIPSSVFFFALFAFFAIGPAFWLQSRPRLQGRPDLWYDLRPPCWRGAHSYQL